MTTEDIKDNLDVIWKTLLKMQQDVKTLMVVIDGVNRRVDLIEKEIRGRIN